MSAFRLLLPVFLFSAAIAFAGCDGGGGERDAGPDSGDGSPDADGDADIERPPEICLDPGPLGAGPYFTDVTEDLGLGPSGLDIQGGGVVSADLDGDRWPDLVLLRRIQGDRRDDPAAPVWNARVLRNEGGESFEDVSMSSGLLDTRDGGWGRPITVLVFADVDNDGDVDAYSGTRIDADTASTGDVTEIMMNQGDGTFVFGPEGDFCEDPDYDVVYAASFLDHDLDGAVDLFVGHQYLRYGYMTSCMQDSLFAGAGDGTFVDVTHDIGLGTDRPNDLGAVADGLAHKPTWGATACDVDVDGWPDLLVMSYGRQFNPFWHAQGDGTYREIGQEIGFWSDEDEDFTGDEQYRCHCHEFGGDCDPMPPAPMIACGSVDTWTSTDEMSFRLGGNSSSALCGDLDGDGDMDVVTVELRHWAMGPASDMSEILVNEGVGSGGAFDRPGREATGLTREHYMVAWNEGDLGGALLDFDNDGRLDVLILSAAYPLTHSLLYHQLADGTFEEVGEDAGARIVRGIGGTLVDYDRDGDHDLVIGSNRGNWEESIEGPRPAADFMRVLRNDVGQDSNRVMVHLEGSGVSGGANRSAIGARIEVRVGDLLVVREVMAGEGHDSYQHDPLQILGVGDHCRVDEVSIRWPNADHTVTTIPDVPANYVLVVREGEGYEFQTLEEYVGG